MSIEDFRQTVQSEIATVNQLIISSLESKVTRVNEIGHYIVNSGGKRIRPLVSLLCSKACQAPTSAMTQIAVIIEFIHTATLLHDDVVDSSELRRGKLTANAAWDNASAVLVGDFVYSRAFQLIAALNQAEVTAILAETTNVIAEGEVLQLMHKQQSHICETDYLRVLEYKTAKLFEAACQLGAVIANESRSIKQALANYGKQIGLAFQLTDDVLDYLPNNKHWGKQMGDDLREGKATLPLIYAMQHGSPDLQAIIKQAIRNQGSDNLEAIQHGIVSTGGIDYTMQLAKEKIQLAKQALSAIPDSVYKQTLCHLADFVVERQY